MEGFLIAVVSQAVKFCEILRWLLIINNFIEATLHFRADFSSSYYLNVASCSLAGLWQVNAHRYRYR